MRSQRVRPRGPPRWLRSRRRFPPQRRGHRRRFDSIRFECRSKIRSSWYAFRKAGGGFECRVRRGFPYGNALRARGVCACRVDSIGYTVPPRAIGATVSAGALHAQGWGFESLIAHHLVVRPATRGAFSFARPSHGFEPRSGRGAAPSSAAVLETRHLQRCCLFLTLRRDRCYEKRLLLVIMVRFQIQRCCIGLVSNGT